MENGVRYLRGGNMMLPSLSHLTLGTSIREEHVVGSPILLVFWGRKLEGGPARQKSKKKGKRFSILPEEEGKGGGKIRRPPHRSELEEKVTRRSESYTDARETCGSRIGQVNWGSLIGKRGEHGEGKERGLFRGEGRRCHFV